jgi:hypothetical protein
MIKNCIKQLHTLPVSNFSRYLTTEYSETKAHFNGNFDTDNQIYDTYRSLSAHRLSERTVHLYHFPVCCQFSLLSVYVNGIET